MFRSFEKKKRYNKFRKDPLSFPSDKNERPTEFQRGRKDGKAPADRIEFHPGSAVRLYNILISFWGCEKWFCAPLPRTRLFLVCESD